MVSIGSKKKDAVASESRLLI